MTRPPTEMTGPLRTLTPVAREDTGVARDIPGPRPPRAATPRNSCPGLRPLLRNVALPGDVASGRPVTCVAYALRMTTVTCPCRRRAVDLRCAPRPVLLPLRRLQEDDQRGLRRRIRLPAGRRDRHARHPGGLDAPAQSPPLLRPLRRPPLHRGPGAEASRRERLSPSGRRLRAQVPRPLPLRGRAREGRARALRRNAGGVRRLGREGELVAAAHPRGTAPPPRNPMLQLEPPNVKVSWFVEHPSKQVSVTE